MARAGLVPNLRVRWHLRWTRQTYMATETNPRVSTRLPQHLLIAVARMAKDESRNLAMMLRILIDEAVESRKRG